MYKKILPLILLFAGAFYQNVAQVPANDECTGATAISTMPFGTACSASVSASTAGATRSTPAPSCASNTHDDDIWYSFTASSASVMIRYTKATSTTTGNQASPSIALYESSCPTGVGTFFCSVVNGSGSGFRIVNGLTIGTTYYLRLWSLATGIAMTVDFCVQDVPAAPANDECSNAADIATLPPGSARTIPHHTTTVGATRSTPDPSCSSTSHNDDIWYTFTTNTSAIRIEFSNSLLATSSGNANLGYALYRDSCPTSTATIVCNGNLSGNIGSVTIGDLLPGARYYLRFFSVGDGNYMTFDFCLIDVITPINDECGNALPISLTQMGDFCAPLHASTASATQSSPDPDCAGSGNNDDIWYRFTSTTASIALQISDVVNNETGQEGTLGFALYQGACPANTTTVDCNAIVAPGSGIRIINDLVPGETYFLRFWSTTTAGSTISFDFCVKEALPAANDECTGAVPITIQSVGSNCNNTHHASTAGATRSLPDPDCSNGFNDEDIWYSFVASGNAVRINFINAVSPLNAANMILGYAIHQGTCPASAATISCNTNIGSGSGTALIGSLVPGQTYLLRFFSFTTNNYIEFDFCLQNAILPANDECINATNLVVGNGFCTSPVSGNLSNSTTSAGLGAPACVPGTNTEDIWYKVTVPLSGNVVIQTSAVNIQVEDLVMEAWAGACGSLSLINCDDNGNPEAHPSAGHARISLTARTPGEIIFLRVLAKGSSNYGPFAICAWDSSIVLNVSPGGNCLGGATASINEANGNQYMWVPVFDLSGNIMAEIYGNGNNLNTVNSFLYVNSSGTVRDINGHFYLDRNITLEPAVTGSARIRMYFKNSEFQALKTADPAIIGLDALKVNKTATGCLPAFSGTATVINQDTSGNYGPDHFLQFSTFSFSSFFIDGGASVLPLEFLSFKAEKNIHDIVLDWIVVQDATIDKFEIQRSNDGISFVPAGEQNPRDYKSDINGNWQYVFTDATPAIGTVFYRIKMKDVNGKQVYSKVVAVTADATNATALRVYPNPVSRYLVIKMPVAMPVASISLFNSAGVPVKQLWRQSIPNGVYTMDLQNQPAGIYLLQVSDGQQNYRFKVIKQ